MRRETDLGFTSIHPLSKIPKDASLVCGGRCNQLSTLAGGDVPYSRLVAMQRVLALAGFVSVLGVLSHIGPPYADGVVAGSAGQQSPLLPHEGETLDAVAVTHIGGVHGIGHGEAAVVLQQRGDVWGNSRVITTELNLAISKVSYDEYLACRQ
jgi:hypothetical protein